MNFAHASRADFSPVSSFIARSSIRPTVGCETRLRTMAFASRSSMGGTAIGADSARIPGSNPCISSEALPMQPALTKVRRSIRGFPDLGLTPSNDKKPRSDYASGDLLTTCLTLTQQLTQQQ